jgi:hypothetical protein
MIGIALHDYHDAQSAFPSGTVRLTGITPERRLSWLASLLPYLEEGQVYRTLDLGLSNDVAPNDVALRVPLPYLLCPGITERDDDDSPGLTHYVGMAGVGTNAANLSLTSPKAGFFGYERRLTIPDIKDGLACTVAVIESESAIGPWLAGGRATVRGLDPDDRPYIRLGGPFGTKHRTDSIFRTHPVLANVAFADASARPLDSSISAHVLECLATVAGGETIDESY